MATYTPANDSGVTVYMPGQDQYPQYYWQDASKTVPASTAGDLIRAIDSGILLGPTWVNYGNEDARRPALGSDGGVQFSGTGTSEDGMQIASSTTLLNTILTTGYADIGWMFKCDSGFGFTSSAMIDNNGFVATQRGLHFGTVAVNTSHAALRMYWGNGSTNLLTLQTVEEVDNNAWNRARFHAEPGNGKCWLQVGKGARVYGTLTGSLGTGAANSSLFIGRRAAGGTPFKGQLKNIRIGTTWGASSLANWETDSPAGTIAGDPELASANIHLNLNKTYYYCPRFIYFNGQQISDPTDSDGTVYRWDDPGGAWVGSGHGADDPRGVETVISATVSVDGASSTLTNGEQYSGGSVSMTRETSTIAYSSQRQTVTVAGNAKYEHIRMVRNSTSGTFGRTYPIRNTRALSFEDYLALDIDGQELESGTTNAADGSEHFMPQGTWALAQWSSSLQVMALIVMTNGWLDDPNYLLLILDTPQNKRVYQTVIGYAPSTGDVLEMGSVTKFYDTTSGEWEALAASEMQRILAGVSNNQRFGMRMGPGF